MALGQGSGRPSKVGSTLTILIDYIYDYMKFFFRIITDKCHQVKSIVMVTCFTIIREVLPALVALIVFYH